MAAAHSVIVDSAPAQGETVESSPRTVEATFNEDVSTEFAHLTVMRDGTNHASGEPRVEGRTVAIDVPDLAPGEYTVGYRVVSADGHPVQGSFTFTVAGAATDSTPAAAAGGTDAGGDSTAAADSEESTDSGNIGFGTAIAFLGVFVVVLIGGSVFLLRRQKSLNQQYSGDDLS